SGLLAALPARTIAISIVSVPYLCAGTAATPTASTTYTFGIAAQRLIP
ncbi:hypothetical protein G3W05_27675, partial [Klebsiella variicola]|nr:hypothetical protein [Klebsiella variicola]